MKKVRIDSTFKGSEIIVVPDDWEWDGELDSLLEFTDISAAGHYLSSWEVFES